MIVHLRAAMGQQDVNLIAAGSSQGQLKNDVAVPGGNKRQHKDKENNKQPKKKEPNFATKASAKIKTGRSTVTDGNYWKRVILTDAKTEKPKANLACKNRYSTSTIAIISG